MTPEKLKRLDFIEETAKAFIHWKTVAGDGADIEESPVPDIQWLISELKLAWKELEQSKEREKILEEALVKIDRNGCELLNHECSSCDAYKVLSEVRKMRGESE